LRSVSTGVRVKVAGMVQTPTFEDYSCLASGSHCILKYASLR
jgi:hypothetical protein